MSAHVSAASEPSADDSHTAADRWASLHAVPVRLSVEIVLPPMSLRQIAALTVSQLLVSDVSASDDLPVQIAGAAIGWARFESVDERMTMRMTRLS